MAITMLENAAPIALEPLAARIRRSSNFQFSWQWFRCDPACPTSPAEARRVLSAIIENQNYHQFLRNSFSPIHESSFEIGPLHEHSFFAPANGKFENIVARAAADRLGAYSRVLAAASERERSDVRKIFEELGPYASFQLVLGRAANCPACEGGDSHPRLFTNWFFNVAWDWCFIVMWKSSGVVWVGCLTDTD